MDLENIIHIYKNIVIETMGQIFVVVLILMKP